jgi:hypothetical protein
VTANVTLYLGDVRERVDITRIVTMAAEVVQCGLVRRDVPRTISR